MPADTSPAIPTSLERPRAASAPGRAGAGVAVFERRQFERALGASVVPAVAWQKLEELDALLARVNGLYE
ncbi:MAG TPA: hypothetical protein VLK29_07540 [Luteimonas sp.]|nr:hypothetical protein [Luteimonas sp.]